MTLTIAPPRTDAALAALLPWPAPDAHKYSRGRLALVAGSPAYPGAACLAATASQRAGAGYTEVFCAGKSLLAVRAVSPSLVAQDWRHWQPSRGTALSPDRPGACVIGCGFAGEGKTEGPLVMETLRAFAGPLLVDGGALTLLASATGLRLAAERACAGLPLVLTPHGGEAARLARAARISEAEPALLAGALARAYGAVCVLKGPDTYVSDGTRVVLVDRGTAALAKAGTGDVLAGIIGALLAQGLAPLDAAVLGATLHAEAGRVAEERHTAIGVIPEDVVEVLPEAFRCLAG